MSLIGIPDERLELEENEGRMTIAHGSLLPDNEKMHLLVQAGMRLYEHPFIVAKVTNKGILGTDFFTAYGSSIDFARNKVCLDGEAMVTQNGLAGNRCYRESLMEEVVIPAGHQMVVQGKVLAALAHPVEVEKNCDNQNC